MMEFKNYVAFTHDKNGNRILMEFCTPETKKVLEKRIATNNPEYTGCYGETRIEHRGKVTLKMARNYLNGGVPNEKKSISNINEKV